MRIGAIAVFLWMAVGLHGAAPDRLRVVATILPVYCIATNIGAEWVEVRYLVGAGGDGHDYQLTPRDRSEIEKSRLLLMNGLGIEPWLQKTLEAAPPSLRVVVLSGGLKTRLIPVGGRLGVGAEGGGSTRLQSNPHIWLDPQLMAHMVTNALKGFQEADPVHASDFARNAAGYVSRLRAVDEELSEGLKDLRGTALVTYHDAFPYFARRYGLRVIGVVEEIPDVDPTPRHLSSLSATIRAEQARAIFVEPRHSRRLAERLGSDLGIKVATLDTLEAGNPAADAYERGMRGIGSNLRSTLR